MNRRNFIAHTAAAISLGVTEVAAGDVPGSAGLGSKRLYKVIFDRRFDASRLFAAGAARMGWRVEAIAGDVTALWGEDLQPRWARGEGAIVGMTTAESFFCLELLARDHWMKVVARAEHRAAPNGTVSHRLFLPSAALADVRAALGNAAGWSAHLAAPLVGQLDRDRPRRASESVLVTADRLSPPQSAPLVSWVIAA